MLQIIDMNLVRDKVTKEPKGVAFMWYRTRAQASLFSRDAGDQGRTISSAVAKATTCFSSEHVVP